MKKVLISINLPLDLIHDLYRMAIKENTIIDEVIEKALREAMNKNK